MASSCALKPTATLPCDPRPEKVSAFSPVPSCRCRSCNCLSIDTTDCRSGERLPPIPEMAMASSQLQDRVQHLLHCRHHARVGAVGILQREQMRQLGIDVDAGG